MGFGLSPRGKLQDRRVEGEETSLVGSHAAAGLGVPGFVEDYNATSPNKKALPKGSRKE